MDSWNHKDFKYINTIIFAVNIFCLNGYRWSHCVEQCSSSWILRTYLNWRLVIASFRFLTFLRRAGNSYFCTYIESDAKISVSVQRNWLFKVDLRFFYERSELKNGSNRRESQWAELLFFFVECRKIENMELELTTL